MSRTASRPVRLFPLALGVILAVVVVWGFLPTLDARLLAADPPRPAVLYVHAALMAAWTALVIAQGSLVAARRTAWHRRVGAFGLAIGAAVPVLGVATTLAMARFHRTQGEDQAAFIVVSLFDMAAFAVLFGLAALWRRRPDRHGRLMLMAACGLAVPAFARLPWMVDNGWYLFVDALIVAAAVRDKLVLGQVHAVYRYGLPLLIAGQALAMWTYLAAPPAWLAVANALIGTP